MTSPKEDKASLRDFSSIYHDSPPTKSLLEEADDDDCEEEVKNLQRMRKRIRTSYCFENNDINLDPLINVSIKMKLISPTSID